MRLLVTGAFGYRPDQLNMLESLGVDLSFQQDENGGMIVPPEEIDAVVCNGLFLHHDIDMFSRLKYIQLTSAGLDRVPVRKINDRNIVLHNARGVYSIPMAEWAVCKVLDLYKATAEFSAAQGSCRWVKNRSLREIYETKVAIVGAGSVGREVARRFHAFGAEVTGFDLYTDPVESFDRMCLIGELSKVVSQFDILILTAPLTEQTYHLVGHEIVSGLKFGAVLVNIARGALIDEVAMCGILQERSDVHAVLDVFETEPLPDDHPLWTLPNVTVSPHNSFVSNGNNERMFAVIYQNLKRFLEKQ